MYNKNNEAHHKQYSLSQISHYRNIIVSCCLSMPNFLAIRWGISVSYTCGDHDQLYRMPFLDKHINDMLLFIQACITLNQLLPSL